MKKGSEADCRHCSNATSHRNHMAFCRVLDKYRALGIRVCREFKARV